MSVGGNIFREESFLLHSINYNLLPGRKGINSVTGLLCASVWASVLGPWATQYHWSSQWAGEICILIHILQKRNWRAQIDEVTFLKRSQWRHIFKSGFPDAKLLPLPLDQHFTVILSFHFTHTSFWWTCNILPSRIPYMFYRDGSPAPLWSTTRGFAACGWWVSLEPFVVFLARSTL